MTVDKWNDIVNKYNDTYYSRIRIKPVDVEPITYIGFGLENNNDINRKFKVCDHIRIIKHKTFFAKGYISNWSEENFVIKKVKHTFLWKYDIIDVNSEEVNLTFSERHLQLPNQIELRVENVIKRKGDKLYVKMERIW